LESEEFLSRRIFICLTIFFLLICFPVHLQADTASSGSAASDPQSSGSTVNVNGYLSTRYIYRTTRTAETGRISDQNLFGELRLDVTTPKDNKYEFHFFGTARGDLSNNRNETGFFPLRNIGNTYRSSAQAYLYDAHIDFNNILPHLSQIKVGRQPGVRDEPVFFDGLTTDVAVTSWLKFVLYGGVAVHFFELDDRYGSDYLGGAGVDYAPFSSTKISLDYLSVYDKQQFPSYSDQHDQLIALKLWQRISTFAKASAKLRYINGDPRDMSFRVISAFPGADVEVYLNYFHQFRTQNELSTELSSFYAVMGQSFPFQSYDIKVRKLFGSHYAIDVGYFKRELRSENQENSFNKDFSRMYALFELIDLPMRGLSFTLTGEHWETPGRYYDSAGFDMGYAYKNPRRFGVNAGTYYSVYKYDYYTQPRTRENVRTYYVKVRYPLGKDFSINCSYEYEDSLENYQMVRVGMRYDF
jgi:hypothetical protein